MIRLIAMDMDGTLLNEQHAVSPYNMKALQDAHKAGIELVISSGRIPDDASMYALKMGFDDMKIISLNGGCWIDRPLGNIHDSITIRPEISRKILSIAREYDLRYGAFAENLIITDENPGDSDPKPVWATHLFEKGVRCAIAFRGEGIDAAIERGLNKWIIMDNSATGRLAPLTERVRKELPELEVTSSWWSNIEINAPGTSKGAALRSMSAALGIPMEEVMAIGDNSNDVSMIKAAGYGVAMGNGTAPALEAAGYVTLNNALDGVGAAIRRLALGEDVKGVRKLL